MPAKMQVIRKLNNYMQINIISPVLEICSSMTGKICSNLQHGAQYLSLLTTQHFIEHLMALEQNTLNIRPRCKEHGLESGVLDMSPRSITPVSY